MQNFEKLSIEELKDLQVHLGHLIAEKRFPNRTNAYREISSLLKDIGFTVDPNKDDRYLVRKDITIFNCPHMCGQVRVSESQSGKLIKFFPIPVSMGEDIKDVDPFIKKIQNFINELT